ncbi:MAG: hypothetical protein HRU20_29450 [Pseudomonadales bacterium]|nr:hypothetical protein [Pseudomonadales bacterium]
MIPGRFGAALHLSDFALRGADAVIKAFHKQHKTILVFCIAPSLSALSLGHVQPIITIGSDEATAAELNKCGAVHRKCRVADIIIDKKNLLISSPA